MELKSGGCCLGPCLGGCWLIGGRPAAIDETQDPLAAIAASRRLGEVFVGHCRHIYRHHLGIK